MMDSWPSHVHERGFFVDSELVRTASVFAQAARASFAALVVGASSAKGNPVSNPWSRVRASDAASARLASSPSCASLSASKVS